MGCINRLGKIECLSADIMLESNQRLPLRTPALYFNDAFAIRMIYARLAAISIIILSCALIP